MDIKIHFGWKVKLWTSLILLIVFYCFSHMLEKHNKIWDGLTERNRTYYVENRTIWINYKEPISVKIKGNKIFVEGVEQMHSEMYVKKRFFPDEMKHPLAKCITFRFDPKVTWDMMMDDGISFVGINHNNVEDPIPNVNTGYYKYDFVIHQYYSPFVLINASIASRTAEYDFLFIEELYFKSHIVNALIFQMIMVSVLFILLLWF